MYSIISISLIVYYIFSFVFFTKVYEQKLKDNEIYIQKIQKENNEVKRQLIDFGKKHEGKDIIDNQRNRDDAIQKKEEEYQ